MSVIALSKPDYDALNVVVLKKMASAATISQVTGVSESEAESILTDLSTRGLVVLAGDMGLPTDDAEPALKAAAESYYAQVRGDARISELVDKFEVVNARFLLTMSAWQQIDVGDRKVVNDHSDPAYDEKVIDRLERLIARLDGLLDALAGHDSRFAQYGQRFKSAMNSVDEGRHEMVSSPTADSVHNVWFEFHEDLLRTIGRERTE